MSADLLHRESPLLFWTIIIISIREHPLHSAQFSELQKPFKTLLSGYLVNSIRSIYTIQSLLCLCVWPLPVANQWDDPSWNYCGLAVSAALQMGLYRTRANGSGVGEVNSKDDLQRLKTWLGCFVVSTS